MIITIDGAAGTGKSTVAKKLATKLGFTYFDTGAMFRATAFGVIHYKVPIHDEKEVAQFLKEHPVTLRTIQGKTHYFVGTVDATEHLRRLDVTDMGSKIAVLQSVREALKKLQREVGQNCDAVFEGRDMGSVVFPNADLKIFLTASPEVQAQRRHKELIEKGENSTFEQVLASIHERDTRDRTRTLAPLKPAPDAHIIDTSNLTIDQVIEKIVSFFEK